MSASYTIGGDPGTKGGLAVLDGDGRFLIVEGFHPGMTLTEFRDVCRRAARRVSPGTIAWVERVNSRPGEGHVGAFTFGHAYGWLEMGLAACDLEVRHVDSLIWQGRLECVSGGNKNVTKRRAQELFPDIKITHTIADALLIARYGWLKSRGGGGDQ